MMVKLGGLHTDTINNALNYVEDAHPHGCHCKSSYENY